MTLTHDRLEELLGHHDPQPYNGRGMYGRECPSVMTEEGQSVLSLLADIITGCEDEQEAAELLRAAKTDGMGRGQVIYWPSVKAPAAAAA